jgi:hypothetical protein
MDTAAEPRPGDEDFDGFRMRLPEDCVEYMLFVISDNKAGSSNPSLEAVRKAADQKLNELAKDYIWQRDPFKLETKVQKGACFSVSVKGQAAADNQDQASGFPISMALPTTATTSRTSGSSCTCSGN